MNRIIVPLLFCIFLFAACDDGKIYPPEPEEVTGLKATLTVRFSNLPAWPDAYQMVFAAYGENKEIPQMSKMISLPASESEEVSLTLNGLAEDVQTVAVSILTKGRKRIYNLYTYDMSQATTDVILPVSRIDVASLERIQSQVFNNHCAACHGATGTAAAGLFLTSGTSHKALVDVNSTLSETGMYLVKPEDPAESFLIKVLKEDIVKYNHTDVLPESELITLMETWIKDGARE